MRKLLKTEELNRRANAAVIGGNHLLSKHPSQFSDNWPSYFLRAKGCNVICYQGKSYLDFSHMGVGCHVLGYSHEEVNDAVMSAVSNGVGSTLNCFEEVLLAELLKDVTGWDGALCKFARTGGEANTIAVRLARYITGKEKIGICGYHGWHDWYLSANLADESNLDQHLFPQLGVGGVPSVFRGLTKPFHLGNFDEFEHILRENPAAIFMEVQRASEPNLMFLKYVQRRCRETETLLIFDECTSGFRQNFGGLYDVYGLEPDIVVFGKTIGNGHPITAVIMRDFKSVRFQDSFISSTFWSERVGPAAALKTLEIFKRDSVSDILVDVGSDISDFWKSTFQKYELPYKVSGLSSLLSFELQVKDWPSVRRSIIDGMLRKGFLASNTFYASIAHTDTIRDSYKQCFENVVSELVESLQPEESDNNFRSHGFNRLND